MSSERVYITISDSADVRDDFRDALERGDTRFVGVMGYSLEVPGVQNYEEQYSQDYGVKVIEGTSDSYPDSVSFSRGMLFREYARDYNELLLRYIKEVNE